ncbi:hypothetical protein GT347_21855 [Xylophilus rhododendri]|uniref:Histidine phosphatase family protein n=1 Tax=Xylophilus rhododendri TaxID=2697032 RepID=A0A857JBF8_9BURK|nr:hypothetical protein [Xylophilus rhododendri]QHJ00390.1 hypothetical protein GT347_21855 [Xylophilus rhododendri]
MKTLAAFTLGFAWLLSAAPASADVRLVMFRHGEKPAAGLGQLSCQGLNRALALPRVLFAAYGKPAALYAPNPGVIKNDNGKPYHYIRPLATIEPTAIRAELPVNTRWAWNDIAGLQEELLLPSHEGQTLYVAWEHHLLEAMTRQILTRRGSDPAQVPKWQSEDFDSIHVLTLRSDGTASFQLDHQGLDRQGSSCPG